MMCAHCQAELESVRPTCPACGEDPELDGRFRLESVWQKTPDSVLFKAQDRATARKVAVKMVQVGPSIPPDVVESAEREARILTQLRHAHVPDLLTRVHVGSGTSKRLCLVMALIEGPNLAEIIQTERMTETQILHAIDAVAGICEDLHSLRPPVVHRDIRPENLIRQQNGTWFLVDFQAAQEDLRQDTGPEPQLGYSAPEQLAGESSPGTDLFSLGVIAVHLLSRRHPKELWTRSGVLDWEPHVQASTHTREILHALLENDPKKRLQDAKILRQKLREAIASLTAPAVVTPAAPAHPPAKHKGDQLFALSIVGIFFAGIILGPLIAFLAHADLHEMDAGRMDPTGRHKTKTAYRISIGVVIFNVGIIVCSVGTIILGAVLQ